MIPAPQAIPLSFSGPPFHSLEPGILPEIFKHISDKRTLRLVCKSFKDAVEREVVGLTLQLGFSAVPGIFRYDLPKLRHLSIENVHSDASMMRQISSGVSQRLESLHLIGSTIDKGMCRGLLDGSWCNLQELRLSQCWGKGGTSQLFAKFLERCPSIRTLDLTSMGFDGEECFLHAAAAVSMPGLETVNADHVLLKQAGVKNAGEHWTRLGSLSFSSTDAGVVELSKTPFSRLEELRIRHIHSVKFSRSTIACIRNGIGKHWASLKRLEVDSAPASFYSDVLDTVVPFSKVVSMSEFGRGIPGDAVTVSALSRAAREGRLPAYEHLHFENMLDVEFDSEGFIEVLRAPWPNVTKITMHLPKDIRFGKAKAALYALHGFPRLESIDLNDAFSFAFYSFMNEEQSPLHQIRDIRMSVGPVSIRDMNVAVLGPGIFPNLRRLDLHGRNIDLEEYSLLFQADWEHPVDILCSIRTQNNTRNPVFDHTAFIVQ